MLDSNPSLVSTEIRLVSKAILVSFDDSAQGLTLQLPSAADLRELPEVDTSKLTTTVSALGDRDYGGHNSYRKEAIRLLEKEHLFADSLSFRIKLSNLYDLAGEKNEAERHLRIALDSSPTDFVKEQLGEHLLLNGDYSGAFTTYLTSNLNISVEANLRLAQLSVQGGKIEKAREYVGRAINIDCTDYRARMFEGCILLSERRWASAIRSFRVASLAKPPSSVLEVNLAAAYWMLREDEKAIRSLKIAVHLDPTNENAAVFLADILIYLNRPMQCIPFLEKAVKYRVQNSSLMARLGKAYTDASGVDPANRRKYLEKALGLFTAQTKLEDVGSAWNSIGAVYGRLDETQKAKRYFAKALHEQSATDIAFANLLTSMVKLKEFDDGYKLAKEYLKGEKLKSPISKYVARIYQNYVVCMDGLELYSNAVGEIEKVLLCEFDDVGAKAEMLLTLFYLKAAVEPDDTVIEKYSDAALSIIRNPAGVSPSILCRITNNFVFSMLTFGDSSDSDSIVNLLSSYIHVDPYSTATLGLYHLQNSRFDRAKKLYGEAVSLAGGYQDKNRIRQRMYFEFGKKYMEIGDFKSAKRSLLKADKRAYGFDYVGKEVTRLLESKVFRNI